MKESTRNGGHLRDDFLNFIQIFLLNLFNQWECKLVQPLWKTVWRFLKKLKIELPNDPAITLLDAYPKKKNKPKTLTQRDICTSCSLQHYLQ